MRTVVTHAFRSTRITTCGLILLSGATASGWRHRPLNSCIFRTSYVSMLKVSLPGGVREYSTPFVPSVAPTYRLLPDLTDTTPHLYAF